MKFFSTGVPAGRLEYFLVMVAVSVLWYLAAAQFLRLQVDPVTQTVVFDQNQIAVFAFCGVFLLIVSLINQMRRLTDLKQSHWLVVCAFIPIVNFFFGLYLLFAAPSHGGTTHTPYGTNPYDPNSYVAPPAPGKQGAAVTFGGKPLLLPGEETWGAKDEAA